MRKAVLIGQAPSASTDGKPPFVGRSGKRLARWTGVDNLRDVFDLYNLVPSWPGKQGKGDKVPRDEMVEAAYLLISGGLLGGRQVVLVGQEVRDAFIKASKGGVGCYVASREPWLPFAWIESDGSSWAWVPHPSGINRAYNDPVNVRKARKLFGELRRASALVQTPEKDRVEH